MTKNFSPARARRTLLLGTSAATIMITAATGVNAQCAPDPTSAGGVTNCTGSDMDGFAVTTPNTTVNVAAGAIVSASSTAALTIEAPASFSSNFEMVNVSGQVQGIGTAGISLYNGLAAGFAFGPTSNLALTVATGGSVSGTSAVVLAQSSGNTSGLAIARIDNSGALSGASGLALSAGDPATGGFSSIINRTGATISGTIAGSVGSITNGGQIDGGAGSAVDMRLTPSFYVGNAVWTNTGSITSGSSVATLRSDQGTTAITNSGIVSNTGSGTAISGNILTVTNQAGGQIAAAGGRAVAATNQIALANAGTIVGDVAVSTGAGDIFGAGSVIDSTAGMISGNVTLGSSDDVVVAKYIGSPTLQTGISGTIDGGGGANSVRINTTQDTVINTAVPLPTNFQRLQLATAPGTTLTLADGFVAAGPIALFSNPNVGSGAIVNTTSLTFSTQAFTSQLYSGASSFTNRGTIRTTSGMTGTAALVLDGVAAFVNSGLIDVVGDGVRTSFSGSTTNTGTIISTGTTLSAFGNTVDNQGVLRSIGGTALSLSGNVGERATNSGLIEGAVAGVRTSIRLTNTGTIASTSAAGTAVVLDPYGLLINLSNGVVGSGNGSAAVTASVFNSTVVNGGTINGAVSLLGGFVGAGQQYISLTGGVLNGNLALGDGSLLVTDIANSGPGSFAGITGTVTAGASAALRYRVSADATASPGPVGPFQTVSYELANGATLSLSSTATQSQALQLAGTGSVRLDAAFSVTSVPAIQSTTSTSYAGGPDGVPTQLSISSAGAVSLTRATNAYPGSAVSLGANDSFTNTGTITIVDRQASYYPTAAVLSGALVTNGGRIVLDGATGIANAVAVRNTGTITQAENGLTALGITGANSVDNRGTISVGGIAVQLGSTFNGGPLLSLINSGTISSGTGTAISAYSNTRIENSGTILGSVRLGSGNDTFVQRGSGTVSGVIDGGSGTDSFIVDSTGNSAINGNQIVNFDSVTQIGTGEVAYSGTFTVPSILLNGGALSVATGRTLTTAGATTIIGGDVGVKVINNGSIAGAVRFGGGNDRYVEGATSSVRSVDGGGGTNLYEVALAGDRTGIAPRTNFQQLALTGTGRLTLTLDQSYQSIAMAGTTLAVSLAGRTIGSVIGSEADEQFAADGDIPSISLGGGDDVLALGAATLAGRYDGGTGSDTLRLTASGPTTLSGTATGFEVVENRTGLTIAGTLQNAGRLAFTGGGTLAVADGGMLLGMIDLGGAGTFSLSARATLEGSVSGGGASSAATIALAGDRTLSAGTLSNFQRLTTEGTGTLTLAGGAFAFETFNAGGSVVVAADSTLAVSRIVFGGGNDRFTIAGRFSGSVDGGAGLDSVEASGGTFANPVMFGSVTNVESVLMSGGFATVASTAVTNSLSIAGGRLVGLAGSTITAPAITVARGATFGSAGTVNGSIAVAGTLSPGASPGTMIVNGNVALASGSTTLFEITPTVSDKLVVNGQLSIASGATLQIAEGSGLRPGAQLDLVTATGGISGTFGTVLKPAGFFGLVIQDSSRIRLLGQFLNDPAFSPQVSRAINYVNGVLASGTAGTALLAAAPSLLTSTGATNTAQFARVGPEPYAAARQIAIENGLTIIDAARGEAFAQRRDAPGMFTFGTALGNRRSLAGRTQGGTAQSTIDGYGLSAGLGWAGSTGSVSLFGGYLNSRQRVTTLGARTDADGVIAGAHGSFTTGSYTIGATVAYDGGTAKTRRSVLDGTARGNYELHGWTLDATVDYQLWSGALWEVRPAIGFTAIRAIRAATTETGSNALSLTVARRSDTALFADGKLAFMRPGTFGGMVRPYLLLGARYQIEGRDAFADAGLAGNALGLIANSARRARLLVNGTVGAEFALSSRLSLFASASGQSGAGDYQATGRSGVRLGF